VKVQRLGVEGLPKLGEEQPPEQRGQHPHWQEEARATGDPTLAVGRHAATGHNAVQVRVMHQALAPGMQHGDEADVGAQVLGIGSDRAQGIGAGAEQDVVDDSLVLVGDRRNLLGHGEDDVEVFDRQELGLPVLQPLGPRQRLALRAVPVPAAVERDALMAAGVALLDVTTQRCRATVLDVGHDTALSAAERVSVILTIGRPDLAEDVRHLEPRGAHRDPQK